MSSPWTTSQRQKTPDSNSDSDSDSDSDSNPQVKYSKYPTGGGPNGFAGRIPIDRSPVRRAHGRACDSRSSTEQHDESTKTQHTHLNNQPIDWLHPLTD